MAATDYFITPSDLGRGAQRFRWEHAAGLLAGLLTAGLVFKFTTLGPEAALFGALLIALMIWRSDPRWLFGAAIGSFGAIIIVSSMWREVEIFDKPLSERMAVWSFYFLVIGVMLLIVESYWPKDGSFNAMHQSAPRAASKQKTKLPERVKQRLKRQREAEASQQSQAFKHPVLTEEARPVAHDSPRQFPAKQVSPLHIPAKLPPAPTRPTVLPHMAPMALPRQAHLVAPKQPLSTPVYGAPAKPAVSASRPRPFVQPAVQSTVQPVQRMVQQPRPIHLQSPSPKPQKTNLLDLRTAKPVPSPMAKRMVVSVKSDSPLPSKRRKLVQL